MLNSSELIPVIRERIESACEEKMGKHGLMRKNADFKVIPFSPYSSTKMSIELVEDDGFISHYYRVRGTARVVILNGVIPTNARALEEKRQKPILEVPYSFTIDPVLEAMKRDLWGLQEALDEQNSDGSLS